MMKPDEMRLWANRLKRIQPVNAADEIGDFIAAADALLEYADLIERSETLVIENREARRLLARARLVMDHIHRDGIGPGFIKTREDIAEFLGLPSEQPAEPLMCEICQREIHSGDLWTAPAGYMCCVECAAAIEEHAHKGGEHG